MFFFMKMASVCELSIRRDIPITMIYGKLKNHVILFDPPYDISSILMDFCHFGGQPVKIIVHHSSRDVDIVQPSIASTIISTTVRAFQGHRLQMPHVQMPAHRIQMPTAAGLGPRIGGLGHRFGEMVVEERRHEASHRVVRDTGKTCCICMESILDNEIEVLPCAHVYHGRCIARWAYEQQTCPECRCPLA